jgi:hypothetical protein
MLVNYFMGANKFMFAHRNIITLAFSLKNFIGALDIPPEIHI